MNKLSAQTEKYLNYCEHQKRLDIKTLKAYRIDLSQFCDFLLQHSCEADKDGLEQYIGFLHQQYKPKTVKRKMASLKAFFSFLVFEEELSENPFTKLKVKFREPFLLPKTIPLDAIQRILEAAYQGLQQSQTEYQHKTILRDIAVLEVLFAIGARVSEICSLRIQDVDLKEGGIKIYGKGAKERLIQIGNPEVLHILIQYNKAFKSETAESGYFFVNRFGKRLSEQSVRNMIKKYVKKCGLPIHITPHMYRHTFATLLLEEDVDIRYIQKFLGHSSILTTQIYTHVAAKKQKQILADKHPRNRMRFDDG